MAHPDHSNRRLDVVVFGATGFVGRLVARRLAQQAGDGVRIGLAGRSSERLAAVRNKLGAPAANWPLIVADAHDRASLDALAADTRVVATTVGPYARHGLELVGACARAGTHYADLTGEVLFVRDSIVGWHATADATGARIVHACGFDSVPSDLAVLTLAERAALDGAGELTDTTLVLRSAKGGVSGGTVDSLRNQVDMVRDDRALGRVLRDPYALSPDRAAEPDLGDERDQMGVARDERLGIWTGPFVMASFNTRIVRRSNALREWAYGRRFRYREVVGFGSGPAGGLLAGAMAAGIATTVAGLAFPPARALLDRVLPAPGDGPTEQQRRAGHFRFDAHTRTSTGARYRAVVAAQGDPGYAATAVMLSEAALALACDGDRLPDRAGVLTPATAIGAVLADRLRAADFRITVDANTTG